MFLALTSVRIALAVSGAFLAIICLRLPRHRTVVWIARYLLGLALLVSCVVQIATAFPAGSAGVVPVELLSGAAVIAALAIDELIGFDVRSALQRMRR